MVAVSRVAWPIAKYAFCSAPVVDGGEGETCVRASEVTAYVEVREAKVGAWHALARSEGKGGQEGETVESYQRFGYAGLASWTPYILEGLKNIFKYHPEIILSETWQQLCFTNI